MLKWGNSRGHRCWGLAWLAPLGTWGSSASWFSPPSPRPATVSVTCGHAWLAVVVPAGFLGSRVASGELTLGSGCGVTTADGDGYWLKHLLVGCGTTLEVRSQGWPRVPDGGSAAAWSSSGRVEDGRGGDDHVPRGRDSIRASFDDLKPGSCCGLRSFLGAGDREGTPALSRVRCPPAPCLLLCPASPGQHPLQQHPPLPPFGRGSRGSCQTLLPPRGLLLPQVSREPHGAGLRLSPVCPRSLGCYPQRDPSVLGPPAHPGQGGCQGGCLPTGHTAGRGAGRLSPCSRMLCGAGWAAFHLGPSSPPGSPSVPPSLTGDAYVSPWMCMTVSGGASDPFIPLGGGGHPPTWLGCWGNAWGSHSHVLSRYLVLPPAPAHLFPGGTDQHRGVGEHRPPAALEGLRG